MKTNPLRRGVASRLIPFLLFGIAAALNVSGFGIDSDAAGAAASAPKPLAVLSEPLGDALDDPALTWRTGGDALWFATTNQSHDGVDAAQAGPTLFNEECWLETTVTGPGLVTFWWKVVSDPSHCCDALWFYVGGNLKTNLSGTADWRQLTFTVPYGPQTLRWEYTTGRDDPGWPGAGWLDEVRFTPVPPAGPTIFSQPCSQTVWTGGDMLLAVEANGTEPFSFQWRCQGDNLLGANSAVLVLTNIQPIQAGNYTVIVSNPWGMVTSAVATVTVTVPEAVWEWARRGGGSGRGEFCEDLAVDPAGNTCIMGIFLDTVEFGPWRLTNYGALYDVFLVKCDPAGNALWARQAGGPDWDQGNAVAMDAAGNVYVTGAFPPGTARFDTIQLTSTGGDDLFLAKYDANGNVLWVAQGKGSGDSIGRRLAVDAGGNVHLSGQFFQSIQLGTNVLIARDNGYFLARFDRAGGVLWLRQVGAGTPPYEAFSDGGLALDGAGNVYQVGGFNGVITFGTQVLTSSGGSDFFLAKYDPAGNVLWARQSRANPTAYASASSVSADAQGDVFVAGTFRRNVMFEGIELVATDAADMFLAKYDGEGRLLWIKPTGGSSDAGGGDGGTAVADAAGNLYVAGRCEGMVNLGGRIVAGDAQDAVYVAKYSGAGDVLWVEKAGLPNYSSFGLRPDPAGNVYLAGGFRSQAIFGTNVLASLGYDDIYLAKLANVEPLCFIRSPANLSVSNGCFRLQLFGLRGRNPVIIQASTNLIEWESIFTNTLPAEPLEFCDPIQLFQHRFYRAVVP